MMKKHTSKVKSTGTPTAGNTVGVCGDNMAKKGSMSYVDASMMNAMGTTTMNKDYPLGTAPKPNLGMLKGGNVSVNGTNYAK